MYDDVICASIWSDSVASDTSMSDIWPYVGQYLRLFLFDRSEPLKLRLGILYLLWWLLAIGPSLISHQIDSFNYWINHCVNFGLNRQSKYSRITYINNYILRYDRGGSKILYFNGGRNYMTLIRTNFRLTKTQT